MVYSKMNPHANNGFKQSELKEWCQFCNDWDEELKHCDKHNVSADGFNWCNGWKEKKRKMDGLQKISHGKDALWGWTNGRTILLH